MLNESRRKHSQNHRIIQKAHVFPRFPVAQVVGPCTYSIASRCLTFRFADHIKQTPMTSESYIGSRCPSSAHNPPLFFHEFCRVFFDLVKRCLEVDPKNRISAKQALEHDYFRHRIFFTSTMLSSMVSVQYLLSLVLTSAHRLPMRNTPRVVT
jgi:serine/threonine protein kinase